MPNPNKVKELAHLIRTLNSCKTTKEVRKQICGKLLGRGCYRNVYECKLAPEFVVKIERNMVQGMFCNVTEYRNWQNLRYWNYLAPWLAECITISEFGNVLIQRRVNWSGRKRKDYPKQIPFPFTDTKISNFGWIGDKFVCCDYAYLRIGFSNKGMFTPQWKGSIKQMQTTKGNRNM